MDVDANVGAVSRRGLFRWAGAAGIMAASVRLTACVPVPSGNGVAFDGVGGSLHLAPGFSARLIALGGQYVPGTTLQYRVFPDGAATFPDPDVPGGWYLAVNHEVPAEGGVTSIRFGPDGTITGARSILSGTWQNCAGGATPWGTWLSCEEVELGQVYECDPTGANPPVVHPAMGSFQHEAAAVAADGRVYLTEDRKDGCFYRFTPDAAGDLSSGLLEVATGVAPGPLGWAPVPTPSADGIATRKQVPGSATFDGGEGIDTLGDLVWFTTKGDDRIWQYSLSSSTVEVRYQGGGASTLSGVDNLWHDDASGVLLVAEDGGNMEVVAVRPDDTADAIVRIEGHDISEITGPCFSPDGQRLYFSSQRAPVGSLGVPAGATYEVTGPFDALLGRV